VERQAARIFRQAPSVKTLRDLAPPVDEEFKLLHRQRKDRQLQPRHYHALQLFNAHFLTSRNCRHTLRSEFRYLSDQLDRYRTKLASQDQEPPRKKSKQDRPSEPNSERLPPSHPSRLQPPSGPTVDDLLAPSAADGDDTPPAVNPPASTPEPAPPARKPVPIQTNLTTFAVEFPTRSAELNEQAIAYLTQATQQLADDYPDLPKPVIRINAGTTYRCV